MEQALERDCTSKCRSSMQAKQILNCVTFATPSQIRSYAVWLCQNFAIISDELGRNLMHIASSCGKHEIVEWLLKQCGADVDVKDHESGWTALHRSLFYGQLASAQILCINGASLKVTDHDGLTPLDIVMRDRLPYIEYLHSDPCDVYCWGSNVNDNLGLGGSKSRDAPEVLEFFHKSFIDIQQVNICKFHSVFLTKDGKVYTCGYGHGGRLGQESEDISLVPSPVKGLGSHVCTEVAAGQDHLLLLLENRTEKQTSQVWSCGLNIYHQLGLYPPPESVLAPKPLSLKFLKGKSVKGICAARFHSVIYTRDSVLTFGLNAGQLGHPKGERTQLHPRQVSALVVEDCHLTHVATSDGAIVCATSRGDVYVLHEYQIRKITSRQLEIRKLSVVGGHLDSRCDVAGVREGGGLELRVALLTKSGKVYLWRQTDPYLRRCLFTSQKELLISDIHINHYSIGMITSDNEGYLGNIISFKGKRRAPPPTYTTLSTSLPFAGLTKLLETNDCHFIKVKQLANVYRGTSITSDSKGTNFAVLQSNQKMGLVEVPMMSESKMQQDFSRLYLETHKQDDFHDVIIRVDEREFPAHKFILASRSDYFRKQFSKSCNKNDTLTIDNLNPDGFEQVLKFIYSNHCDFLTPGYEVKWASIKEVGNKGKPSAKTLKNQNPISIVQEISKKLNMNQLAKGLDKVTITNGKIFVKETDHVPGLMFNRQALLNLCDVNLISSSGAVYGCHRCILAARLDYFHSMLSTCWAENSELGNLSLPISCTTMEVLLELLYTDDAVQLQTSDDIEFLCQVLVIADQLLLQRLKEICEIALLKIITLKNAAELLELSSVYNAVQLKRSCMQFICLNLAAVLESKIMDVLSDEVMDELSTYYRNLVPSMHKRRISHCKSSFKDDLDFLEKHFPVSGTSKIMKKKLDVQEIKSKNRRRCNSLRSDTKEVISITKNDTENPVKNIVLDIVTPEIEKGITYMQKRITPIQNSPVNSPPRLPGQWIMKSPTEEHIFSLEEIMLEERMLTSLQKKMNIPDRKPLPHLSQRQRKLMESVKNQSAAIPIPNSPPNRNSCPWAKLPEQSPPSPSFWDSLARKDLPSSPLSRELSTPPKGCSTTAAKGTSPVCQSPPQDIVISLHDIQKDEELKLHRIINQKIKPLHILNIEDQAIEELLVLYNAVDNHKEKITVCRVQAEEIASPVWKKRGH